MESSGERSLDLESSLSLSIIHDIVLFDKLVVSVSVSLADLSLIKESEVWSLLSFAFYYS